MVHPFGVEAIPDQPAGVLILNATLWTCGQQGMIEQGTLLVRNGKITREEAVHLVKKYDQEFPDRYFADFLDYIDLTEAEFWETVDRFRSPHLWKPADNQWALRHQVQ